MTDMQVAPDAKMPKDGIQVRQDITLKELAVTFHQSGFFSDVKSAAQAVVKIMAGHELGISPIASMRGIHVFEGKVELSGPMMAALIKRSPKYQFKVVESTGERCEIAFWEFGAAGAIERWEECGPNVVFDRQDAVDADLAKFDDKGKNISTKQNWRKYLADMLMWRCLSRGFRRYCSELAGGDLYVTGEISEAIPRMSQPQGDAGSLDNALQEGAEDADVVDPTEGATDSGGKPTTESQPVDSSSDETEPSSGVEPDPTEGSQTESTSPPTEAESSGEGEGKPLTRDAMLAEMKELEEIVFQKNIEMRDGARVEYLSKPQPAHCTKKEIAAYHEFLVRHAQNAEQATLEV
jgi:hypothetical protein